MEAKEILILIAIAVGSYLLGSINFALILSRRKSRVDIRTLGSGNPGTMNMLRNYGKKVGALCLILDAVKGVIPCVLGWFFWGEVGFDDNWITGILMRSSGDRFGLHAAAFSVIMGHCFPIFMKFKGGKGIAASLGVCLVFQPLIAAITIGVGIGFIFAFHLGSIGSFIMIGIPMGSEGWAVSAFAESWRISPTVIISLILIASLFFLTVWKHRKNIVKLFNGTESKTLKRKKKEREKGAAGYENR